MSLLTADMTFPYGASIPARAAGELLSMPRDTRQMGQSKRLGSDGLTAIGPGSPGSRDDVSGRLALSSRRKIALVPLEGPQLRDITYVPPGLPELGVSAHQPTARTGHLRLLSKR